ncbi:hypothetical protein K456DRAFT_1934984 [Colletotrichum gloeosporioides 23]|nr:hypothetical protein K456DRAFT_1934984 [Colletotrichum gloeosporioides 23]
MLRSFLRRRSTDDRTTFLSTIHNITHDKSDMGKLHSLVQQTNNKELVLQLKRRNRIISSLSTETAGGLLTSKIKQKDVYQTGGSSAAEEFLHLKLCHIAACCCSMCCLCPAETLRLPMQGLNPFKDANERVPVGTGIPVCSVGTSPLHVLASTSMLHGLDDNRRPIAPLGRGGKCREVEVDFQQSRNRDLPTRQICPNRVLTREAFRLGSSAHPSGSDRDVLDAKVFQRCMTLLNCPGENNPLGMISLQSDPFAANNLLYPHREYHRTKVARRSWDINSKELFQQHPVLLVVAPVRVPKRQDHGRTPNFPGSRDLNDCWKPC